jgi:hypothetical protein
VPQTISRAEPFITELPIKAALLASATSGLSSRSARPGRAPHFRRRSCLSSAIKDAPRAYWAFAAFKGRAGAHWSKSTGLVPNLNTRIADRGGYAHEIASACKGARPNHVGAAISRHKRAGARPNGRRPGTLYAVPVALSFDGGQGFGFPLAVCLIRKDHAR